jgi:AmmeMemoRadiSam system protein A
LAEFVGRLAPALRQTLLDLARASIGFGLQHGRPLVALFDEYPAELQARRASFVTLQRQGALRGCIGSLEARRPLVADVTENAYAAAFRDPRFAPLASHEFADLEIHLSLLTPAEPMEAASEADLLRQLRPGEDGLILQEGSHRATFLPAVWESLPEPRSFIRHLKQKAGLPAEYWSDTLTVLRYRAEHIP